MIESTHSGNFETESTNNVVESAKNYYNNECVDAFYYNVWGGDDIHVGIYENPPNSIREASRKTVKFMASMLPRLVKGARLLDIGSGYGGSARFLASARQCHVACLNISRTQNDRNRLRNDNYHVTDLIEVHEGNFEALPFMDRSFDVVWSQDAIMHSDNRRKVLEEVNRVLRRGGEFIFTDPMRSDNCTGEVLQPLLNKLVLKDLGSPAFYFGVAEELGWKQLGWVDLSGHLVTHYRRISEELAEQKGKLATVCGMEHIDGMEEGLRQWVNGGEAGQLCWGIFHFRKE